MAVLQFHSTLQGPKDLNECDLKSFSRYVAQIFSSKGRLHRRGGHTWNKFHQLVIWEMDREKVLRGVHEEMGHKGLYPMRRHLIDQFWWPSVFKDVKAWVRDVISARSSRGGRLRYRLSQVPHLNSSVSYLWIFSTCRSEPDTNTSSWRGRELLDIPKREC